MEEVEPATAEWFQPPRPLPILRRHLTGGDGGRLLCSMSGSAAGRVLRVESLRIHGVVRDRRRSAARPLRHRRRGYVADATVGGCVAVSKSRGDWLPPVD